MRIDEKYIQFLNNLQKIKQLEVENEEIFASIQEAALLNCPFKIDDIIKGKEIGGKIRAVKIRELKVTINNNGFISYIAIGWPMNLDGNYLRNNNNIRKIYIDENTIKID